jgi:hypothetical protein
LGFVLIAANRELGFEQSRIHFELVAGGWSAVVSTSGKQTWALLFPRISHSQLGPDMLIRDILNRARHDGCGGRAGKAELLTGIDGSSRPVRRILLSGGG